MGMYHRGREDKLHINALARRRLHRASSRQQKRKSKALTGQLLLQLSPLLRHPVLRVQLELGLKSGQRVPPVVRQPLAQFQELPS